ncbi:MAG: hypothetical protein HWN66_04885 [Candidatus Helarchaeota archaeon]|nr:hypothetical protein [Candidatus Helarchaeota archaeon]
MSKDKELEWQVQKKFNIWNDKRKHSTTLEELFDGNVRYLKLLKSKGSEQDVKDGFQATVDFTFEKNMGALVKLGAAFLKRVSKKILLKKIISSFFINMQHVVKLDRIKKYEFYPDYTEIIIKKCTGKRAFKLGLKNNNATNMFGEEDYCKYSCITLFNKLLSVANAKSTVELEKRGCHHIIKFVS